MKYVSGMGYQKHEIMVENEHGKKQPLQHILSYDFNFLIDY
jgi:hypothetical protein